MVDPNLITSCNFHGQEFLFKMNVLGNNLEIMITDKNSGEEWQCSYDATYIENLTHKTGNFKQFNIFITMLKSGLLRTSECVTLDLLTFEDLESLRSRKIAKVCGQTNNNRRYLIVTYCVEFDKIRYPLPLEYCGPPDPLVLQATIKRLEAELERVKGCLPDKNNNGRTKMNAMQKKIDELINENIQLKEEILALTKIIEKKPKNRLFCLEKAMDKLERSVVNERNSHHNLVEKLRKDKMDLARELEKFKTSEKILKKKLKMAESNTRFCHGDGISPSRQKSDSSVNTVYRRQEQKGEEKNATELKAKQSRSETYWNSYSNRRQARCSRRDALCRSANKSRSSSNSSTKCQDKCRYETAQPLHVNERSGISRFQTPAVLIEKNASRSSSAASRCSSRNSTKKLKLPKHSDPDFQKLEDKIESLQRMLKRNFIK